MDTGGAAASELIRRGGGEEQGPRSQDITFPEAS